MIQKVTKPYPVGEMVICVGDKDYLIKVVKALKPDREKDPELIIAIVADLSLDGYQNVKVLPYYGEDEEHRFAFDVDGLKFLITSRQEMAVEVK